MYAFTLCTPFTGSMHLLYSLLPPNLMQSLAGNNNSAWPPIEIYGSFGWGEQEEVRKRKVYTTLIKRNNSVSGLCVRRGSVLRGNLLPTNVPSSSSSSSPYLHRFQGMNRNWYR